MVRVRGYIVGLGLILLLPVSLSASDYSDCSIVSQSSSEITFVYHPGSLSWIDEGQGDRPAIPNTAVNRAPGYPVTLGRIVYIALPLGSEHATLDVDQVAVVDRITHASNRQSLSAGAVATPYPDSRATLDQIFTLHGVRVARLTLHPVVLESTAGEYTFAHEIRVRLRFDRPAPPAAAAQAASSTDPFVTILRESLLNPEGANWYNEPTPSAAVADSNPFAGGSEWIAIRTVGDGIVSLTGAALRLAGIQLSGHDPRQFRLFAGPGRQLSTLVSNPAPQFEEVAITVVGGDDGVFSDADQILFWSDGLNRWVIDSTQRLADVVNRYDVDNVYWLALSHSASTLPKRIASLPSAPIPGAVDLFDGRDRARHEEDAFFRVASNGFIESYYTHYWHNQRRTPLVFFRADDIEPGRPATLEVGSWAGPSGRDSAVVQVGAASIPASRVLLGAGEDKSTISTYRFAAFDPTLAYTLAFDTLNSTNYFLDYFTLEYDRRLDVASGPVKFAAPDTSASVNFVVTATGDVDLWDLTDPHTPQLVSDPAVEGSSVRFGASLAVGSRRVYYAAKQSARRSPQSVEPVQMVDLHTPGSGADYIAIGPRSFEAAMQEFLDYRSGTDGITTRFVAIEDVYNSYSLGLQDPVAIRRFLRHTHFYWPGRAPVYALLVGDGTNDFLNHKGTGSKNYVPPYIVDEDNTVSDESFVYFSDRAVLNAEGDPEGDLFPDMLIGRWPVRTTAEVANATAKIKRYESMENLGPWRSRVMMVADDEYGDRDDGSVCEYFHIQDAEAIADSFIPPRFDVEKIYLTEYPFDNPGCYQAGASGCTKPLAKQAIIDGLNDGVAVFNYLGHGNPDLLAHEHVFERSSDLPRLTNVQTPTVVLTFSCSIGFFDDPASEGMSEEWFRIPQGGVVAVVSATRVAAALANAELNDAVFDLMFTRGVTGIASALYTAKLMREYSNCGNPTHCGDLLCPCENDRGYNLLGDPAMRLGVPPLRTRFTGIAPDSLTALALTNVEGEITDTAGALRADFDGTLYVTVRDVPRHRVYPFCEGLTLQYDLSGGTLYRGQVPVSGGRFAFAFVVPKDIAYGQVGARIMGHAVGSGLMANGATDSLRLASSSAVVSDTTGPTLHLRTQAGEDVVDGFMLPLGQALRIEAADPSGLNLTGSSGHALAVFVDDLERPFIELTDAFLYDAGAYDRGTAPFALDKLELGAHRLLVKAWDNANNSSVYQADVQIVPEGSGADFRITEFLNFPNPFAEATTFYFRATRAVQEARIRLYTVAGRLIWESTAADGITAWDGRDQEGDRVANGVYLAQLEAKGSALAEDGSSVDKKAYREMKVVVSR